MTPSSSLQLEDFDRLKLVGWDPAALSPDGQFLCFPLRAGRDSPYGADSFWVADTNSGALTQLRDGKPCFRASWSPADDRLAYYSADEGALKLWCWDPATGESELLCDENVFLRRDDTPQWSPDGKKIYLPLRPQGASAEAGLSHGDMSLRGTENHSAAAGLSVDAFVSPSPESDVSFPGEEESLDNYADIAVVDLTTGETSRLVTGFPAVGCVASPDGNWLAVIGLYRMPEKPAWRVVNDLHLVTVSGGTPRTIGRDLEGRGLMGRHALCWSADSSSLAFVDDRGISVASVPTGEVRRLECPVEIEHSLLLWTTEGSGLIAFEYAGSSVLSVPTEVWHVSLDDPAASRRLSFPAGRATMRAPEIVGTSDKQRAWSPEAGSCVLITQDRETKASELWRVPLDGAEPELLLSRDQWISRLQPSADGNAIVFAAEDETCPADFWLNHSAFGEPRRITELNPEFEALPRGRYRAFSWTARNGTTLHGAVLLPPDYAEGESIPIVIEPYPGVAGSNQMHVFGTGAGVIQPQILATRGFGVVLVDLQGPVAIPPVDGLMPDIGPCVDELVRSGIADPDRLGVMGQSGGGGAVNRIITETTTFRAAVCVAGVANAISWFGQFDVRPDGSPWMYGSGLMEMSLGGAPWDKPDDYLATSPVMSLDRVETPLLLIYGTADDLVGAEQGGEMFAGLYRQGKKATFARYRGEGHVPAEFNDANRQDVADRVIEWFAEHLGAAASNTGN